MVGDTYEGEMDNRLYLNKLVSTVLCVKSVSSEKSKENVKRRIHAAK